MKAKLTKTLIDSLQPKDAQYDVWDTELKGFGLRVGTAKKTFVVMFRIGRTQKRYTIGNYGTLTPAQARDEAQQLLARVAKGEDVSVEKKSAKEIPTFESLAAEYLRLAQKRSLNDDKAKIDHVLLKRWGKRRVTDISTKDVRSLIKSLQDKGPAGKPLTPATCNRYLALTKVMFTRAIEWGYVASNPAQNVKPLQENNQRETFLSLEQVTVLFEALEEAPRNAANCIKLALLSGQRMGDCMAARWDQFDSDVWVIPKPKSGKRHHVYLSEAALSVLEDQRAINCTSAYVFPGNQGNSHLVSLQQIWVKVRAKAGLPENLRLHDLRHTHASLLINSGASLYDVQRRLGHADSKTTQRYSHLSDERQRQIAALATDGIVTNLLEFKAKKANSA